MRAAGQQQHGAAPLVRGMTLEKWEAARWAIVPSHCPFPHPTAISSGRKEEICEGWTKIRKMYLVAFAFRWQR